MLGLKELKKSIKMTKTTAECPVKGCEEKVARQKRVFKRDEKFKCPKQKPKKNRKRLYQYGEGH